MIKKNFFLNEISKKRVMWGASLFLIFATLFGLNRLELFDPLSGISFSKTFYSQEGELLRVTLSDDEQYRLFVSLKDIPEKMQEAVLLSEDQFFYYHYGVNPFSLLRAVTTLHEARPVGASTITMQYVRLKHKLYTKSWTGKIQQIFYATASELLYSKRQILEAYLNLTPYGANIEGVGAASLIYFKRQPMNLRLEEILLLAVIPQNPLQRGLQKNKQDQVLKAQKILAEKWSEKFGVSVRELTSGLPVLQKRMNELPFEAPHFTNFILSQSLPVKKSEWKTTLNRQMQKMVEKQVQGYLQSKSSIGVQNAAVLILDATNGSVKTWMGSGDFYNDKISGQIDGVTTPRSPGSTLKPFVYALAMDEGLIHSQSLLYDTPSSFGLYDPENFDRNYKGPLSAEEALIQSRNVPAIYLTSRLKKKTMFQLMTEAQVPLIFPEKHYGLGLSIGVAEVSPLKLGELYMALFNHGVWKPTRWIADTEKTKSSALSQQSQILSPESSYIIRQMLQKNMRSESVLLDRTAKNKISVSWKTGTSYGFRDAWVAGVVGQHVIVVWLGAFDNTSNPALIGRDLAAPLFFQIVEMLHHRGWLKSESPFDRLATKVKSEEVCALSGQFSKGHCPHHKKALIIPGVSPIDECQVHRTFLVSKKTGRRVCLDMKNEAYSVKGLSDLWTQATFEVWPSDVLQLFVKFGIPYNKLPPLDDSCLSTQKDLKDIEMIKPQIVSPKFDVKYSVRFSAQTGYEKIPFKAIVDQQSETVFWFANQKPLGRVKNQETLFAELEPGSYEITVVDDQGQVATRQLQVQTLR